MTTGGMDITDDVTTSNNDDMGMKSSYLSSLMIFLF